jgi:hypothetical protein
MNVSRGLPGENQHERKGKGKDSEGEADGVWHICTCGDSVINHQTLFERGGRRGRVRI